MTLLPVLALGAKIPDFSFSASAFEWLEVILPCKLWQQYSDTGVQREIEHYVHKRDQK